MSAGTQAFEAAPVRTAIPRAATGRVRGGRGGWGRQLWSLLHAQALLNGTVGGQGSVAVIEDDYQRLAARRAR